MRRERFSFDRLKTLKLWMHLTLAFTLVTVIVIFFMSLLWYWGIQQRMNQYIASKLQEVLLLIDEQLATYYQQEGSWSGVGILLERDFPLSLIEITVTDKEGQVVYGAATETPLSMRERADMRPILVEDRLVGYWCFTWPEDFLPGSPEHVFLQGMQRLILVGAVISALVGMMVSGFITRKVTVPLQDLVAASQAVAEGDLSQRVEERGSLEVAQVSHAFNEMTAALAQAEEQRRNLTADLAHELRTPLSVLQGNLRAILDDVYPLEKAEIARLYDETRLLSRLVDDLQELARAEAGQLGLNVRSTDLAALLHTAVVNMEPAAEAKSVTLSLQLAEPLPVLQADPDRLAQVLRNLLTNAVRHTPCQGEIVVTAAALPGWVRVSVTDTGEGIAQEDVECIFERFWRADPSRSRGNGGAGLGLAIAKSLVEAHGGRIWAENPPGLGARFVFELPRAG
jgi:two-component system OmpR family sensor kinase